MQQPSSTLTETETRQTVQLRRARVRATGLLVTAAAGFVASFALPESTATGYVRAALEAGVVGGLADWFAVVALFRHPLGIPIPRTAVIPNSKDRLGTNLAGFVRDNFLRGERVRERIADPAHVRRLGAWLDAPEHAERVAIRLSQLGVAALDAVDEDDLIDRLTVAARRRLHAVPVARLAGISLEQTVREGDHDEVVVATLEGLTGMIDAHRDALRRRLAAQAPAWVPALVNDLVFDRAEEVVRNLLGQVAADPDHELRRAIDERLLAATRRLQDDDAVLAGRLDAAVKEALGDEQVRAWIADAWHDVERSLRAAADPEQRDVDLRRSLVEALRATGRQLRDGGEVQDRTVAALAAVAPRVAEVGQREVEELITATVDRWDAEDTARRLELWLGPDLQFVRMNGTMVGALVGLGLHAVTLVLN